MLFRSHERNRIFKFKGYCFGGEEGIRVFGNTGCQYSNESDVPLTPDERQLVQIIKSYETEQGCQ